MCKILSFRSIQKLFLLLEIAEIMMIVDRKYRILHFLIALNECLTLKERGIKMIHS